jgi:hypothetical protein
MTDDDDDEGGNVGSANELKGKKGSKVDTSRGGRVHFVARMASKCVGFAVHQHLNRQTI